MAYTTQGSVAFTEQAGSPVVTTSPEGVRTVRRIYRGETSLLAAFKAGFVVGNQDDDYPSAHFVDFSETPNGRFTILTANFVGGVDSFVENHDSPTWTQSRDGSWRMEKTFIGPRNGLASFVAGYSTGDQNDEFGGSYLQNLTRARVLNGNLAEVVLVYEGGGPGGSVDFDPSATGGRTITSSYDRTKIILDLGCGVTVGGYAVLETVTVTYTDQSNHDFPQYQGDLSNGSKTYFYGFDNADFDPGDYTARLANVKKKKITRSFEKTEIIGSGSYQYRDTHAWEIVANDSEYSPATG